MEKIKWDWEQVEAAINSLLKQATFEEVDFVVGIQDGGVIPAMMIKKKLKYADFTSTHPGYSHMEWLEELCDYNRILFVDDINDSGETCKRICRKMGQVFGAFDSYRVYQVVTLVKRKNSAFQGGLFGVEIDNDDWIQFPWEEDWERPEKDRWVPLK